MIIAIVAVILLGIIIFMPGNSDSTESVNLGKNSDSTKGVNKEDVKRKICENLDIDYNPDEWVIDSQNSVEYYISGNFIMMLQLNDKKGDVMKTGVGASLNPYSDVENPMQEGTDIQGVFKDHIDKEFTWKCAAVSAMLDCDMDKAASIVRKANKSSSGTTKVDNIVINPHTEVDNTSIFWVINANYAGE